MSHTSLSTWQRATALVPLALLSGAWTASLAVSGYASAATGHGRHLPDGSSVPNAAIEAPASLSQPGEIAPGVPAGAAESVISSASTSGIPAAALAAYQRAQDVINAADPTCKISWELIAAIGRVESDHGRYGGNTLDSRGKSVPGIYGIPLDGSNGTAEVPDTDAGEYDDDPVFDRAIGPMQFIPSTWSVVKVDADGDGARDPQDIDDAALATAVYLCSGKEDLSTTTGQRAAVYRYNHSQDYVNLVLSIANAYLGGDYSAVPNHTAAPTTFTPISRPAQADQRPKAAGSRDPGSRGDGSGGSGATGSSGSTGGGTGGTGSGSTDTPPPSTSDPDPVQDTTDKVQDGVKTATKPAVDTISAGAEAVNFCTSQLDGIVSDQTVIQKCADKVVGMTKEDAAALIPNTLTGVLDWLGLTSLGLLN